MWLVHYLSNHKAHQAKDPNGNMSGRPHEEVDDVGVKWGVKAIDGLHSCQQAVGYGLWYQNDTNNKPWHHIPTDIISNFVFRQPAHHREEPGHSGSDSGYRAGHALLQLGFEDWNLGFLLVDPPFQEKRLGCRDFWDLSAFLHCLREEEEAARSEDEGGKVDEVFSCAPRRSSREKTHSTDRKRQKCKQWLGVEITSVSR